MSKPFHSHVPSRPNRGSAEAAAAFLKQLESWRESLARNIALRNQDLSAEDRNAAVQLLILCLVFLRMAEDRGLEPPGHLLKLCERPGVYRRFVRSVCCQAGEKYHSALFPWAQKPRRYAAPDRSTPNLVVDDEALTPVLRGLYPPGGSLCDFRGLPVEILGTVYERFLGKVVRLADERQTEVEQEPDGRKAGGVFYTPSGIVDYIVQQTLGTQIAGRSPAQLAGINGEPPFHALDMSCGSGSFLLGAYQYLLEHCLKWYCHHEPQTHAAAVFQDPRDEVWRLTFEERKRILTTHVFGVDVDPRAAEVCKLSLLLQTRQGEDDATLRGLRRRFPDRVLPNLDDNIKCGNSLIGPDFYAQGQLDLFDRRRRPNIAVFDWQAEFPQILRSGGFDVVIGNPPYVNARTVFQEQGEEIKRYFLRRYQTARRGYDLYVLFVEKALELLKEDGRCGLIIPNKIATLDYAEACRAMLLGQTTIEWIADVSDLRVFPTAGVYPYILVWRKAAPKAPHDIRVLYARGAQDLRRSAHSRQVKQQDLSAAGGLAIHGTLDVESRVATQPLERRARLHSGTTGFAAERMAESLCEEDAAPGGEYFGFVVSGNIDRYRLALGNVRFMNRRFARPVLSADLPHLTQNKRMLFRHRKLIIAGMARRLEVALDDRGGVALGVSVYAVAEMADDAPYLLGLLNSNLLSYLFRIRFQAKRLSGGFLAINKGQLAKLPVRVIDFSVAEERTKHDEIAALAERMTMLTGQRGEAGVRGKNTPLERQITETDAEIDRLVYELYGLTDDEIRTVEDTLRQNPER